MIAAILLSTAVAAQAAPAQPDAFDLALLGKNAGALKVAEAMHKGFRACAQQVATRKHLSADNRPALAKEGISLRETPPEEVAVVASTMFKQAPIYAQVESSAGTVWLVSSAGLPACKVTVADTPDVRAAREELGKLFGAAKAWSPDLAQSFEKDGLVRQAYVLNKDKPGAHLTTFVDGPSQAVNEGKGIQSIITVGIAKAETK